MTESPEIERLYRELARSNELLEEQIRLQRDWRVALRNGMASGLGVLPGATVLVSVLLWVLRPFEEIKLLRPALERLASDVQKR